VRVLVLSRRSTLYSTRRLVEATVTLGHEAVVVDPLECWLVCGRRDPALYHGASRSKVSGFDVVLPRIGGPGSDYGLAVVNQFDMLGVPVVNMAYAIGRSRDKLRSLQFLSRHDIDIRRGHAGVAQRAQGHRDQLLAGIRGPGEDHRRGRGARHGRVRDLVRGLARGSPPAGALTRAGRGSRGISASRAT
jgi:hypothetical protein